MGTAPGSKGGPTAEHTTDPCVCLEGTGGVPSNALATEGGGGEQGEEGSSLLKDDPPATELRIPEHS